MAKSTSKEEALDKYFIFWVTEQSSDDANDDDVNEVHVHAQMILKRTRI